VAVQWCIRDDVGLTRPNNRNRKDRAVTAEREQGAFTYASAGVDIDAAATALDRVRQKIQSTFAGTGAAGTIGHFGGFYRLDDDGDRYLIASADGVGTKLKLAFVLGGDAHSTVGSDLVNHCANDLLACGAKPLFFLDYVAMGRLDGDAFAGLVSGMANACQLNGIAMIGGETAEMPGMYQDGEYDAAGFIVGEVRESEIVDGRAVAVDDVLIGLPSGGLQTNGYSLARTILGLTGDGDHDRSVLAQPLIADDRITVGQALMAPHRSFAPKVLPLARAGVVTGMAHITGGGLIDNVPRMLPTGLSVEIDPDRWEVPPVFTQLVQMGDVRRSEYHRVLNMGIGFVLATRASDAESVLAALPKSVVIGRVIPTDSDGTRVLGLD
jgi:phosphoribosylformylglycinamidine cyclo-ligase